MQKVYARKRRRFMCRPYRPGRAPRSGDGSRPYTALLGCRGFARVDLFLDAHAGRIVFNSEHHSWLAHSRYPSMMKAAGLSAGILTAVIELAVEP